MQPQANDVAAILEQSQKTEQPKQSPISGLPPALAAGPPSVGQTAASGAISAGILGLIAGALLSIGFKKFKKYPITFKEVALDTGAMGVGAAIAGSVTGAIVGHNNKQIHSLAVQNYELAAENAAIKQNVMHALQAGSKSIAPENFQKAAHGSTHAEQIASQREEAVSQNKAL